MQFHTNLLFFQDSKVENETDVPSVGKYPATLIPLFYSDNMSSLNGI